MMIIENAIKIFLSVYVLSSMVACANLPDYQEYELDGEIIIAEKDVQVETVAATKTDDEIVKTAEQEQVDYIQEEKSYETFSSATAYWKNALKHLQHGNEDEATWALEQALKLDPNNKMAIKLANQIEADAINELGIVNFEYKVQYGDSLSKLAKNYLDDALQFYLLAKYNDIVNPSHLVIGQIINIPGEKPIAAEAVTKLQTPEQISPENAVEKSQVVSETQTSEKKVVATEKDDLLEKAKVFFEENDYSNVIVSLEDSNAIEKNNPEAIRLLVNSYFENSKHYSKEGNIQEAKYLLLKAAEIEPDNPQVNMALINMDEPDETESLYEQGLKALAENRVMDAYELMDHVIEMRPNHKRALQKREEIRSQLVPQYYKQALMAQRKHKLDEAIEQWDEVLALDASNENAKIYRSKAVSLKMKLDKFSAK